jgi:hypothetical protein
MPGCLTFPIKLRCTSLADLLTEPGLEAALTRTLCKAFARARSALPSNMAFGDGVVLQPPTIAGNGLSADQNRALLSRVQRAIEAAARVQLLPLASPDQAARTGRQARAAETADVPARGIAERFDPERLVSETLDYRVPSYQGPGTPAKLPVQQTSESTLSEAEILVRLNGADRQLLDDLFESTPFDQLLLVMIGFAKGAPKTFLAMLRAKLQADGERHARQLRRTDNDVVAEDSRQRIEVSRRMREVIQQIPIARPLLSEQLRKAPELGLLTGLVEALSKVVQHLLDYLAASEEPTDSGIVDRIGRRITHDLPRLVGVFFAAAGTQRARDLLPDLVKDLAEQVRWIPTIIDRLSDVDGLLVLYKLLYGGSADQATEVKVLRTVRLKYLCAVAENPISTTTQLVAVMADANASFADWRKKAGDEKMRETKALLADINQASHLNHSDYWGAYTSADSIYNEKLEKAASALHGINKAVENLSESLIGDAEYLSSITTIQAQLPLIAVQFQMLGFWFATLYLTHNISHHEIGSKSERFGYTEHNILDEWRDVPGWYTKLNDIISEIRQQFDQPNYQLLNGAFKDWKARFERIQDEVKSAARREFFITLGIAIFATIITAGLFAGAGVSIGITLAEAGTFTAITTIGQAVLLDKTIDPGEVIGQFAENALMFGLFKGLNIGALAVAKKLAPDRLLVQLGIVFGTTTLVTTGVPAMLAVLESKGKGIPDETKISLLVNLVMNAAMTLFGGLKTRNSIRQLAEVRLALRTQVAQNLEELAANAAAALKDLQAVIDSTDLAAERLTRLNERQKAALPEFERTLKLLASSEFSDAALAKLGMTRDQVQTMAAKVAEAAQLLANAPANAPRLPPPAAHAVEAPGKLVPELVQTGADSFEYKPTGGAAARIAAQLRAARYAVTDRGGGVLEATPPKSGEPTYLLLPAAEPGAAAVPRGLLERAVGYHPEAEMATIRAQLDRIFPDLAKVLGEEFPEEAALAALKLLAEERAKLPDRWRKDAVRGLAELLRPERGVLPEAVRRLFKALPPDKLANLCEQFLAIVRNRNVRPGANLLVSQEIAPEDTVRLVEAFDAIRRSGLKLPETLSRKAVRGLLDWIGEGRDVVAELQGIANVDQRNARLEGAAPAAGPKPAGPRAPTRPAASKPPPPVKQGSRELDVKERITRAGKVEAAQRRLTEIASDIVKNEGRLETLESRLRQLSTKRVPRPPELDAEFRDLQELRRREGAQATADAVDNIANRPGHSPAAREYLEWLRDTLTAAAERDDLAEAKTLLEEQKLDQERIKLPQAEAELRIASKAVRDFLRAVGENYKRRSNVSYDEVLGKEAWNNLGDKKKYPMSVDHLVALDRIANMKELTPVLLAYEKASAAVKEQIVADLVKLGDIPENLLKMRAGANSSKKNRSWEDVSVAEMKKFDYDLNHLMRLRADEARALPIIMKAIAEMVTRYAP